MVELNTYRIFQEALNNALKYSLAQQITITLKLHAEKGLSLRISDNGTGFNRETKPQGSGMGLTSVETRAQLIGAQLKVDSQPGRGTTIMLEIPNTSLYLGNN
jgi:signal transduction histidine kinase